MRRGPKILLGASAFCVAISTTIGAISGSPQLGLHGGFWISVVFLLWLESRVPY